MFCLEPELFVGTKVLWSQLEERLESLLIEELNFKDKKTLISTIRIAKSLVMFRDTLEKTP